MVRASFARLEPRGRELVDRFFLHAFARHPRARHRLPADLARAREYVLKVLRGIVRDIDDFRAIEPALLALGAGHAARGATPATYTAVRDAMIEALRDLSGPAWTPLIERAWSDALDACAGVMLRGAMRAQARAA